MILRASSDQMFIPWGTQRPSLRAGVNNNSLEIPWSLRMPRACEWRPERHLCPPW